MGLWGWNNGFESKKNALFYSITEPRRPYPAHHRHPLKQGDFAPNDKTFKEMYSGET
jgi:hypothetical protein